MLILFGGFEMGTFNGEFSIIDPTVVIPVISNGTIEIIPGGRSGNYQVRLRRNTYGQWGDRLGFFFPSPLSEFYWQVCLASEYLTVYAGASCEILRWANNTTGNVLGGVKYNSATNNMEVYVGNFATLIGTFPAPPGNSTYWVFELHLKIDATVGIVEIRKDMNLVFSFTGNTKPGADSTVDRFDVAVINATSTQQWHYVDDFILNDPTGETMNSWPGGLRISTLVPLADDGLNEWEPSAAADHYSLIDEIPPVASDYLKASTVDKVERLDVGGLPVGALSIKGVKMIAQANKDSDSSPTCLGMGMRIGGVDYYSDPLILPAIPQTISNQWLLSPATGNNFAVAEVNDLKLLLKSLS